MFLYNLINNILPNSYSHVDQIRATTVITASLAIGISMILLIVYWLATKSFENIKTFFVVIGIMLWLSLCIGLEINGQVTAGAWALVSAMIIINFANMSAYGISTSASSGYILPILLAIYCIGEGAGYAVTILGCIFVFMIAILQSKGWVQSIIPYQTSNLTFDAPTLTLVYILTAIISGSWGSLIQNMLS